MTTNREGDKDAQRFFITIQSMEFLSTTENTEFTEIIFLNTKETK
jgi:hypothetical protein